jgi:hypothetical protein
MTNLPLQPQDLPVPDDLPPQYQLWQWDCDKEYWTPMLNANGGYMFLPSLEDLSAYIDVFRFPNQTLGYSHPSVSPNIVLVKSHPRPLGLVGAYVVSITESIAASNKDDLKTLLSMSRNKFYRCLSGATPLPRSFFIAPEARPDVPVGHIHEYYTTKEAAEADLDYWNNSEDENHIVVQIPPDESEEIK